MQLNRLGRSAAFAARMRKHFARTGKNGRGQPLWTMSEDKTMRALYPDYRALLKALPRRTLPALKKRALVLKIAPKQHRWSCTEVNRLRKLYPISSRDTLCAAFPGLRWSQILGQVRSLGLRKTRKPFLPTGIDIVDAIRARAFELRLTMADLDALAITGRRFQYNKWRREMGGVHRAIEALDGKVVVVWN